MIRTEDAEFVLAALGRLGWTQSELAKKVGVSRSYVSAVIGGRRPASERVFTVLRDAERGAPAVVHLTASVGETGEPQATGDEVPPFLRLVAMIRAADRLAGALQEHADVYTLLSQVLEVGGKGAEIEINAFLRGMYAVYRNRA